MSKKVKRDDCSNYKVISLLNSGYKIYAKIITQRLKTISEAILLEEKTGSEKVDPVLIMYSSLNKK
jgi:hypothetical protein